MAGSLWCHFVHALISRISAFMAPRMLSHSQFPNMLARSRSAATSGGSVPSRASCSTVTRQWLMASQALAKLVPNFISTGPCAAATELREKARHAD